MSDESRLLKIVADTDVPRTRRSIGSGLRTLGLASGDRVIVHSSLSSLGFVVGGPIALVQALMDVITDAGTLVMPSHSYYYADPARREDRPLSDSWVSEIRESMPAFDPAVAPTTHMGQAVEVLRSWPGTIRSRHPVTSFAAWGYHAEQVTADHTYEYGQGDGSPLGRLYDIDSKVLLIGVGYDRNTSFHLADHRFPHTAKKERLLPVPKDESCAWRQFDAVQEMSSESLLEVGAAFEDSGKVTVGKVGSAECRLFSQRAAVNFALDWLGEKHQRG